MAALIAQNMAPIMFVALVVFLLLGYPVAFSLGAVGLLFFIVGVELAPYSKGTINLDWALLRSLPDRIFSTISNETLLAIPFFTFMGLILERSGMAEDLLDTVGQLFGTLRGGLAYAVVFVGALLAATTGVVAASVISMGLISLPIMLRYGYDRRLASGIIAASGTLAQIIPPSIVLIVLADQLGRSVGDMYQGAFLPGMVLAALYAGHVFLVSLWKPDAAPGLPAAAIGHKEDNGDRGVVSLVVLTLGAALVAQRLLAGTSYTGADHAVLAMATGIAIAFAFASVDWLMERATGNRVLSRLARQVVFAMVPPLALIFLVLGTIFIGLATPTEGGAMGAVGAMLLAWSKRIASGEARRFSLDVVRDAAERTAKLSAFVMFILIGARIFSLTFYGVEGHKWVEHLLVSLPGGMYGFLILVNLAVFGLAFFLDFFELAFIIVPLLKPAAEAIFANSPEAISLAKALGMQVSMIGGREVVTDVTPFMIWFGVLLAVNMQTSFMHPPFGFALFYLRSVAPKEPYTDRVTGRTMAPVTTGDIYRGAIPFVVIQVIMVALVLALPRLVISPPSAADQKRPAQMSPSRGDQSPAGIKGLRLPGSPPAIDGAPPPPANAPVAPTIDLAVPPVIGGR